MIMKGGYFLLNGKFHREDEAVFTLADLSRRMEGFSEAFRAEHNEVLFPESISRHLLSTAGTIDAVLSGYIDAEGRLLRKDVSRLLNKNKLYKAARIEIHVFQSDARMNVILRAEEVEKGYYPIQEPGYLVSFYHENRKTAQASSAYSTTGSFVRQGARRLAEALNNPDMILLNTAGYACESLNGSFGCLNGEAVSFPSAGSGGYRCAILKEVITSTKAAGFQAVERDNITMEELLQAEELFLFDACNGIQKVLGLEERRYYSIKTQLIAARLSEIAKKERQEMV
jgi:branched-subunit amino acid aminotransferase/4-amino-4-deoxychorismate lyase